MPSSDTIRAIDAALDRWEAGNCSRAELRGQILEAVGIKGDMVIGSYCGTGEPYRSGPPKTPFEFVRAAVLDWALTRVVVPMEEILQLIVDAEDIR